MAVKEQPARKMLKDKYTPTLNERQILYYRAHPVRAAKDLLHIDLIWLQRITLRLMWFKRFPLLNISRGVGKTIAYNENNLLWTRDGVSPVTKVVKDVDFSNGERWVEVPEIELWNGNKFTKVNKVLVQPGKKCARLTTNKGYFVEGSTKHKIKVLDYDSCKIVWKRFDELGDGDRVCIDRSVAEFGDRADIEEAYLIGVIIGDGSLVTDKIHITSPDDSILEFAKSLDTGDSYEYPVKPGCREVGLSRAYSDYLRNKYSLGKHKSYTKEIPEYVLQSSHRLKAFLQGLFDTDGWSSKSKRLASITTVSEKLANQVHAALLTFGIISKLGKYNTKSAFGIAFDIDITGKDAEIFNDVIGFRLKRKADILKGNIKDRNKCNTNFDVIPGAKKYINDLSARYAKNMGKSQVTGWGATGKGSLDQKELTYSSAEKTIYKMKHNNYNIVKDEDVENLEEIIESNFFFDSVKRFDYFTSDAIDFNVPEGSSYWCNGFVNHNSFIIGVFGILQAMLYPRMKVGIIAPVFRQANFVFDVIDDLYSSSEYFQAAAVKPTSRGAAQSIIKFHNRSFIEALPVGDGTKIRGRRYNCIAIDEYAQMDEKIIKLVVRPMLNIKHAGRENKLIVASTAYYRWNHYFTLYLFYLRQLLSGNKDYGVAEFDYVDVNNTKDSPYKIDMSIIEMQKNDMTTEEFLMENGCFLPGTHITTDEGLSKIEDVRKNDIVFSHRGKWQKVSDVSVRHYEGTIYKIRFKYHDNYLALTPEHPIYDYKTDSFIEAKDVEIGFEGYFPVISKEYTPVTLPVVSIETEEYSGNVYNLEVMIDHSYIAEGVAVHNCVFPKESSSFIPARLIDQCTPKMPSPIEPELSQSDDSLSTKYVLGVDCARVAGGDNFAMQLLKLKNNDKELVHTFTLNGASYPQMTDAIRKIVENFPGIIRINIGAGGGGLTLKDLLAEKWVNSEGVPMLPLLDEEDNDHATREGVFIIHMVQETAKKNNEMYMNLKAELQHKRLLFPIDVKTFTRKSQIMQQPYKEILATKRELLVLEAVPKGSYHKFTVPSKYKKDRAQSLALALDGALEITREVKVEGPKELPIGIWAS